MAAPKPNERRYLYRIAFVAFVFSLFAPLLLWRLWDLQWRKHDEYVAKARRHQSATVTISPQRGAIFSRNGHPLATSKFLYDAYLSTAAVPKERVVRRRLAQGLADSLEVDFLDVLALLERRGEIVVKRQVEEDAVFDLEVLRSELGLPPHALYAVKTGTREYPKGTLASHVVGVTKPDAYGDNVGLSGAELAFDDLIRGSLTTGTVEVAAGRREIAPLADRAIRDAMGMDVVLTIDEAIQHYAEAALAAQVAETEARGGVVVVLEVGSGDVLAMASFPTFDLNERSAASLAYMKNRCLVDSISPGSVMKVFTATALIERNLMSPYEMIDCRNGYGVFPGGRVIRDSHGMGTVTVLEAFAESSNVAFVELGLRLDKEDLHQQWKRFRFGERTGVDLPGEGRGLMRPLGQWGQQSLVSLPIGYEITLTPLQVAAAMAAVANDGLYVEPHVLREVRSADGDLLRRHEPNIAGRVCSAPTSRIVLSMMEEVVKNGTGKAAQIPGYRVGGKTGTTVKDDRPPDENGGKRYYASFIQVLPIDDPRIVVYSWIDEPSHKFRWGSAAAAPVCREVAGHAVRILGIPPTEPIISEKSDDDASEDPPPAPSAPQPPSAPLALPGVVASETAAMPDLSGMSVRSAAQTLHRLNIDADLRGWGLAVRQQPAPGEPLPLSRALVVFAPPAAPSPAPDEIAQTEKESDE